MNITYEAEDFERFAKKFNDPLWGAKQRSSYFYVTLKNKHIVIDSKIKELNPASILDYGCGQYGNALDNYKRAFPQTHIQNYDPFVEQFNAKPTGTFDVVICYNVLNAVRAQFVPAVIDDLYNLSNHYAIVNIVVFNDNFNGEDGRNQAWYLKHVETHFNIIFESVSGPVPAITPGRNPTNKIFWILEKKLVPQPGVEPG